MKKLIAVSVVVGLLAVVGCGKKSTDASSTSTTGASVKASCNLLTVTGTCSEYAKEDPLGLMKGLCEGFKGTYGSSACPSDSLVGTCAMKDDETKKYYVTKDEMMSYSVDEAKKDCENDLNKGKFTAAPNPPAKPGGDTAMGSASGAPMGSAPAMASAAPKMGTTPAPKGTGLPGAPPKKAGGK